MLSVKVFPRNISQCIKHSLKSLYTSSTLNSPDSSSSDSSSDSDSETENNKKNIIKQEHFATKQKSAEEILGIKDSNAGLNDVLQKFSKVKAEDKNSEKTLIKKEDKKQKSAEEILGIKDRNTRLNDLLNKLSLKSKESQNNQQKYDIKISPLNKRLRQKFVKPKKEIPFEIKIQAAAKEVADSLGGDKQATEHELLEKILRTNKLNEEKHKSLEKESTEKQDEKPRNLSDLLADMKVEKEQVSPSLEKKIELARHARRNVFQPSVAKKLLLDKNRREQRFQQNYSRVPELKGTFEPLEIFKDTEFSQSSENIPQLLTWKSLEERQLKLATLAPPANVFEELILWTEQGKIWKFPIDNEQGMKGEENVHFSEHVFMEKHLKGWCPKRGPIRHFMELVCVGLSKNPYLTVQEKIDHIMWFKDYFDGKRALLEELGAIDKISTEKILPNKENIQTNVD